MKIRNRNFNYPTFGVLFYGRQSSGTVFLYITEETVWNLVTIEFHTVFVSTTGDSIVVKFHTTSLMNSTLAVSSVH